MRHLLATLLLAISSLSAPLLAAENSDPARESHDPATPDSRLAALSGRITDPHGLPIMGARLTLKSIADGNTAVVANDQ